MGVVSDDLVKTIQRCTHCGEECAKGVKYCKGCNTAAGRKEVDEENEAIKKAYREKNSFEASATTSQ